MEEASDSINVTIQSLSPKWQQRETVEYITGSMIQRLRRVTLPPIVPQRVIFAYSRPRLINRYYEVFQCEPRFDGPANTICFPADYLEYPIITAQPTILALIQAGADELLAGLQDDQDIIIRVRGSFAKLMRTRMVSVVSVAQDLGMSPRSLQRHLALAGTSFSAALESYRKEMLLERMAASTASFEEIARQIGYSNVSNLSRAAKKWFGVTLSELRHRGRGV